MAAPDPQIAGVVSSPRSEPWRYSAHGLRVTVRVTPRGGRDQIDGVEQLADGRDVLKVRVRAIAEGGEANQAVIALLAKALGVSRSHVRLAAGITSRLKQIDVSGDPYGLAESLRRLSSGSKAGT